MEEPNKENMVVQNAEFFSASKIQKLEKVVKIEEY